MLPSVDQSIYKLPSYKSHLHTKFIFHVNKSLDVGSGSPSVLVKLKSKMKMDIKGISNVCTSDIGPLVSMTDKHFVIPIFSNSFAYPLSESP